MRKRIFTSTIAALALFVVVGLVAALAPSITSLNLARAHSGDASLTALTVTAGTTAQTLEPTFSSTVYSYTVHAANIVAQVTIAGTPDGDGTVTYQYTDAASGTAGHQVNLPTLGGKSISVVVTHMESGGLLPIPPTIQIYTVLVVREGTVATDRAALMALYNSTGGANWHDNTNWGTTEPLNTWYGVYTNGVDRVNALGLGRNNLRGTLPDALGNLDQLLQLQLFDNRLSGPIPASLGGLTYMWQLSLWGNKLTGEIPEELGNLASLTHFYLGGNELSGTIPDSLGNLTNLLDLSLWGNDLEGPLPTSLGNLTNLTSLDISRNALFGPIPDLSRLTSLQYLYLWDNSLSGSIPTTLGSLTNLQQLYLNINALEGTIPDLSRLTNLTTLSLYTNELSGEIPTTLGSLTSLQRLSLNFNRLSGEIPTTLGNLTNLTELRLYSNQLSGEIPDSLGSLTNLTNLSLYINQLSGEIPATLGSLTNLERLLLQENRLTGEIPDSLGNLTNLQALNLRNNKLTGPIPNLSRTDLRQVDMSDNRLTGTIPAALGSLTNLTGLSLWGNKLTGEIPAALGNLTNLMQLILHENHLSGDFPAALGNLTNLQLARFASNTDAEGNPSLTGCVPVGLRYLLDADDFVLPGGRFADSPAHDFIGEDANGDGDTEDTGDTPGLNLPFCMVSTLTFSDVTLSPVFASATAAYTASVANTVEATTVTATVPGSSDRLSIRKGTASYASGAAVPLAAGPNEITITVTPTDGTPTLTYTVTIFRAGVDQETLMALYNGVGGASWTDKTNWGSTTEPLDDWFGVEADSNGNVTELELPGNNLSGTLPAALGSLTSLTTLDLGDNRLSGTLPDLGALSSLTTLKLGANRLSGTIPDWLSSLTSLTTLNLRDNRLTGAIPVELGTLTQLELLYLDDNQLSGPIPAALGGLSGLQATRFAGNSLTGCVPNGLRRLVTDALDHDFIAVDANDDGDTTDDGDTPGLGLPFCTVERVTLSPVTLVLPVLPGDPVTFTAAHDVTSVTVTATLYDSSDTVSIMKGTDTYMNGDPVPLEVGTNVITIEVTPADNTPTQTLTATVTRAPNTPPTFSDGLTTTRGVDENTVADRDIGDPVAATDTENDTLTYSLDTTSAASFDISSTTGQLQTKADLDFEDKSSYTVTVSVSDSKDSNGDGDDVTDDTITVTIQVTNVNEAPVFTPIEPVLYDVDENTIAGEDIGAPVAATDDDNDTLTYSLDDSSRATFDIVATTGQLQTKAALDYETGTNSYTVTVTATDPPGEDDTIDVTITVNNVEEPGTVTLSSTQPVVGTSLTATLTDPDGNPTNLDWVWENSPNGTSSWAASRIISTATTTSSYTPSPIAEGRFLRATVTYDDDESVGKRSALAVFANRVQPAPVGPNERPMFPSTQTTRDVDENTVAGVNIGEPVAATDADGDTLTYSLDPAGAASFDIDSTDGQLQTKAALDFETTASYSVTVTATDTAAATGTISVSITVNNLDEAGTVTLSSLQPLVAIPLTATLEDPDGVLGRETWSWARSPNGASDWTLISGETSATYTPDAAAVGDYLRATASYNDGEGSGKSAQAISANAVELAPGRNAPVFKEGANTTRSIPRNTPAGRNIGAPFTATDADNDALAYSLGGRDRAGFDLDTTSGQLLTKAPLTGIHRTRYTVIVSVSDSKDDLGEPDTAIDATTEVTINITTTTTTRPSRGSSGGGRSRSRATPTPTPTPSPTPTATPTPTGPQFPGLIAAEPSVTATVVPEGTTLGLNGGGDLPGGVYVNFPPTAVALPVPVSVSVSNEAPSDIVAPSGTTLLPLTINITPETPLILGEPITIEINPTPELLEAAGGDLNNLAVGVVTPHGVVVLPAQVLHGRLVVTTDRIAPFVLVAITDPGPVLTQPPPGDASSMGPLLQWTQPPGTTWFQVQVIPFNEDGPGINLVIGDGALVQAAQYQVLGPNFGSADPNYVMLPGMTYLWRVRTSTVLTNPTEADWSAWAVSSFKTPPASSSTITRVAPPFFGEVRTLTPTLTWANSNPAVFYYEVQVSRDFEFGPNAFLYSEYVHGGASTPANSYVVPEAFPLEAGEIYYWRVRPRIQGDGDPLPWSRINVFLAPAPG